MAEYRTVLRKLSGWPEILEFSMLAYAGIGIAMGNGYEEAKAAADHVTGDVEEDGLLQAVHYLIN